MADEHEVAETSSGAGAGVAASWGTCEELLLVSAVKRHGVNNWNLISSELKARAITLNVSPVYFSETGCKQKYDVLRGRFASCSSSTMSQDEEVGNDMHWFEELRKIRVAHLKRELEHYDGSIGSLQVKIKRLKAEKAGDIAASKQLGKSIANAQPNDQTQEDKQFGKSTKQNDQLQEDSTCEVPVHCSTIEGAFGKDLSKGSSLKPCSQALNSEKSLHDKDLIQDPVNLKHVIPECDQWHDAVEDLHDASSGPTEITVDADVHIDNTTESIDLTVEHGEGTVCMVDTVITEPKVLSEAAVDELQDVEAAGVATSSEGNGNMKSEQADKKKSDHLVDKSAESLSRDHDAGVSGLGSGTEDIPKTGVDSLNTKTQELIQDESVIMQSYRKPGADGTSTATADATSNLDICEDGGTVQPAEFDLRGDAEVHSIVSPAASLLCPESSGSMHLGEAGDKRQSEANSTISEEKAAPSDPTNELQTETSENAVGIGASPQKENDAEAAQCAQLCAFDAEDNDSTGDDIVLANEKVDSDADGSPYQIEGPGLSDKLAQDAAKAAHEPISSEPVTVEIKIQGISNLDSHVSKEVSVSGNLESLATGPDSNTAATESVGDDHMIVSESKSNESSEEESAKASSTGLKSASPEGHIVIALDEPNDNVPSRGSSKSVLGPTSSADEETVCEVDVYNIGPDAVSGVEVESMKGKEQPVDSTSRQDVASAERDRNTASVNTMDIFSEKENGSASPPKRSEIVPLVSVKLVQKLSEPEKTAAATSELPSGMEASNLTNNGPAISDQVENQDMRVAEKVVDEPRTSELDAKTDLGQVVQDSQVVGGHNVEDVEHIDTHAAIAAAVLPSSSGSLLPVGHTVDIDPPANTKLVRDLPEIEVASIGHERKLQGIVLDVKLEISKEESLEQGQTSVSRQQVASEASRGRSDADISSVSSPDAAGGDQSKRGGRVIESGNVFKPLTISPAKVKQEILEYVARDRNLQEIMDSAPKSGMHFKLKAEPNSPVESLAGGVEESLKVPSSHEGSDSVQELSKDGGEIRRRQRGVRDHYGESQIIDKSEAGSPVDGNDGMSPSSRRMNRREPRVPGKLVPLLEVLRNICNHKSAYLFKGRPEDPRYHLLIRRHMDLANVRARLEEGAYSGSREFFRDLLLIFNNAMVFYPSGSTEFTGAKALFAEATKELDRISQTEALLKRDGPATRTRELKKPKTAAAAVTTPAAAVTTAAPAAKVVITAQASQAAMIGGTTSSQAAGKSALPGSTPSVVTSLQQQQPPSLDNVNPRKRPSTRSGALETSTNSGAVVDSEPGSGPARSASVNITVAGPSTSRAEETTTTTTRDSSRDGDQEVNGTLKQLGGRKKLHVGVGTSSRAMSTRQAEELPEQEGISSAKSKGASGRASKLIKDVKDALETTAVAAAKRGAPAGSAKAAAGKLKAERENEKKRERESKEKEKRKASERDDVDDDDDDFLLRKGKSLAKLKDQEIIVIQADPVKPAAASSKAAKAATTAAKASNSQPVGRPVRGAARKAAAAGSAKEAAAAARVPEQQPKKRVRK